MKGELQKKKYLRSKAITYTYISGTTKKSRKNEIVVNLRLYSKGKKKKRNIFRIHFFQETGFKISIRSLLLR